MKVWKVDELTVQRTDNGSSPFARRGPGNRKAVPGPARRHNRALVLRTLFRSGSLSRADLARATSLTRVTTSDLAAELLGEGLIEALATELAKELAANADGTLLGLGVGSPGVVSPQGVVVEAPNLAWFDMDLAERLEEAVGIRTHVANDANVAALGELGAGEPPDRSLFLVKVGQGVGAGLVL